MKKPRVLAGADDCEIARWIEKRLEAALAITDSAIAITVPGGAMLAAARQGVTCFA